MGGGVCSSWARLGVVVFVLLGQLVDGKELVVSVDDYGAVGDGVCDDTEAFKCAWEAACSSPSRAVVEVPFGKNYLVGPIYFGGHCLSKMTLLISGNISAPAEPDVWKHFDPHKWLYFHNINHLKVRGGGTINGMGQQWWDRSCKVHPSNPCRHAPNAITFHRCNNLKVENLTIVDSQQMHMEFTACSKVLASNLKVIAPARSPNTDGIHISHSRSVTLRNSIISTGDDCVSIVEGSSKLRIENIICRPGHGISIGSLGKSNSWADVYDIHVDGAVISNAENGVRIKTWQGGRGFARDISFRNIVMDDVYHPIIIDQYYCDSTKPCSNKTDAVRISDISFENITGTSASVEAIQLSCSDTYPCEDILLKDIQLTLNCVGNATAFCWNACGSTDGEVSPLPCVVECSDSAYENASSTWLSTPLPDILMRKFFGLLSQLRSSKWGPILQGW